MKAEELFIKLRVDMSEVERMMAAVRNSSLILEMEKARVPNQTVLLALLGAYVAGTQLRRPVSRRSLLTGGLR